MSEYLRQLAAHLEGRGDDYTSPYGWMVYRDHLDGKDVEVYGPSALSETMLTDLYHNKGCRAFRMYDDDGILYYTGRYKGPDDDNLFGPLDDYGTPNAGCTEIRYRNPETKRWETL